MIDVDALLQSFGDEAPSGFDLEYDPAFSEMEIAAQPGEERVIGDSVIAAEEPDYSEVVSKSVAILERSKDLRAAIILGNAALRLEGLSAFEEVLRYIHGCLDQYWDNCHPQLDADDDNDPTMRVNAVLGLTNGDTILRALRLAPLTNSRAFGRISLRDLQVAEGEITAPSDMDHVPDMASVSAAFQDTDAEWMEKAKADANAILNHVKAIDALFTDKVGAMSPDLTALQKMAYEVTKRFAKYAAAEGEEAPEFDEDDATSGSESAGGGAVASGPARASGGGAINNTNDVLNMIDRIMDYYARNEPSSPVPLLLSRARRLVSADFITIMKDMAPAGVDNVNLIGGIVEEDDY